MKHTAALLFSALLPALSAAQSDVPSVTLTMAKPLVANPVGSTVPPVRGTDVPVFDSFTGADTLTTTTGAPRSFMGYAYNLDAAGGTNPMITRATVYLAYTGTTQAFNSLRVRVQLWNAWSSAATGTALVFSAPATLLEADVAGPVTLTTNTFTPITVNFAAPIPLTGLTAHGIGINFQGDTGAGLVSSDTLTSLLRADPLPPAVGTSALAATSYGYRNASNRTDFNFQANDLRGFTGIDNQGTALQLFAQPAPAGMLTITPTTVAFGNQAVGSTSPPSTVTLANTGTASLDVTALTAAAAPFARAGGTCATTLPITIAAGANCTLTYTFAPTATVTSNQTLTVTANAPGSGTIDLSGTGTPALVGNLTITPATLDFGNQAVGTTSAASTVTLANTGTGSLDVTALTVATAPFARAGGTCATTLPITIAAGANCTLTYTFAPTATGAANQTLTVTANSPGSGTIALSGTGIQGALTITPATVNFGNQTVGSTSAASTVTLANTGTASLDVTTLTAATAPFARAGGTCATTLPITLAAGANCTLTYTFAPTAVGAANQTLTVTANAPGSGSIALSGTGTGTGVLGVLSATVNFGNVAVPGATTATLTLTNTGNAPLQVSALTAPIAPFAVTGGTCGAVPFTIAAGANCTVIYSFTPTQQQAFSQTITVTSDGGNVTVTLFGTGIIVTALPTIGTLGQGLLLLLVGAVALTALPRR